MGENENNLTDSSLEEAMEPSQQKEFESHFEHQSSKVTSCPSCGGNMVFDPPTGNLKCPYCSTEKPIEKDNRIIVEHCFSKALEEGVHTWDEDDVLTVSCQNCGAQLVFDATSQAKFCNYCGSSHISQQKTERTIPPQYVVPFSITDKAATDGFKTWISKRWLAPQKLKTAYKNDKLLGTYVPYWTYDSNTYSYYTAQRGRYYYVQRTRTVNGKTETYQERKVDWTPVSGDYSRFFDDLLISASAKVNKRILSRVEPFDLHSLIAYKPEFLSGFFAERYSVSLEDGWAEGTQEIDGALRQEITRKIGGDEVRFLNVHTQYEDITFKHLLLPVWMSSYSYRDKLYHFMINGQTGEVGGEYPKSPVKITLLVLLGLIAAGFLFYLFMQNKDQNQGMALLSLIFQDGWF